MENHKEMQLQLQRYYSLWKDCTAMYEEWSKLHGLSSNGVLVLYSFCEGDGVCTQKSISQKWCIPKQTVNTILKDFQSKGYIEMVSMEEDKRNKLVRLTESGKTYAEDIIGKLHEREIYVMEKLGSEKMCSMNDTLEQFMELFRLGGLTEHES